MKYALSALISITLVGCANISQPNPPLATQVGSPEPVTRWAIDLIDATGGLAYSDTALLRQLVPDVDQSMVFAAFGQQVISAHLDTHATAWQIELSETVAAGPVEQDGRVFVTTDNAELVALDANHGTQLWQVPLPARSESLVAVQGDRLIVQSQDGSVQARAVADGRILWSYRSPTDAELGIVGTANPVIANGLALVATSAGSILALNLDDGIIAWEYRLSYPKGANASAQLVDADATPLVSGNTVLATAYDGLTYQIDINSGRVLGTLDASSLEQPLLIDNQLIVVQEDGGVIALSNAGERLWQNDTLLGRAPYAPVYWQDTIWVADTFGGLIAIDPETGNTLSAKQMDLSGIAETPVVTEDWMLLMSAQGRLAGIKVR